MDLNTTLRKFFHKLFTLILKCIPIIIFLFLWEVISNKEVVNPKLFPPPSLIWSAMQEWAQTGELFNDVKTSGIRVIIGFTVGCIIGIIVGLGTARIRFINWLLNPLIQLARPLPPVAIIPLVIVWLGIGASAKVFSIAFGVFFPVWLNTHLGATNISYVYLWSAKLLTRSKLRILAKVIFPATLPFIVAGVRISIAIAFIMIFVAEIAGASAGIGYRISVSHLAYRIDKMMAALIVLALAGAAMDLMFSIFIRILFPWTKFLQSMK